MFCHENPIVLESQNEKSHESIHVVVKIKVLIFFFDFQISHLLVSLYRLRIHFSSVNHDSYQGEKEGHQNEYDKNFDDKRNDLFADFKHIVENDIFKQKFVNDCQNHYETQKRKTNEECVI